jgi:hypothetical protein
MQIASGFSASALYARYTMERLDSTSPAAASQAADVMGEQSFSYSYVSFEIQFETAAEDPVASNAARFREFLDNIGYDGRPIAELSHDEAADLISDEGFFGVAQTARRIADFVIQGAHGDGALLRAGREGIQRGFKEAEALWGGTLPDISYRTIEEAVAQIDATMQELGIPLLDTEA